MSKGNLDKLRRDEERAAGRARQAELRLRLAACVYARARAAWEEARRRHQLAVHVPTLPGSDVIRVDGPHPTFPPPEYGGDA
jgi:hypothetical protein